MEDPRQSAAQSRRARHIPPLPARMVHSSRRSTLLDHRQPRPSASPRLCPAGLQPRPRSLEAQLRRSARRYHHIRLIFWIYAPQSHLSTSPHVPLARRHHPLVKPQTGIRENTSSNGRPRRRLNSAAQKTRSDVYLQLSPVIALVIALLLAVTNIRSLFAAGPVLLLWAIAPLVAIWLNSPPRQEEGPLTAADRLFLLQQALHVWRYFHEFGNEEESLAHSRQRRRKGHVSSPQAVPHQSRHALQRSPGRVRVRLPHTSRVRPGQRWAR